MVRFFEDGNKLTIFSEINLPLESIRHGVLILVLQFSAILIWYANIKAKRALKGGKRSCLILLLMHDGRTIAGMSKPGGPGGLGGPWPSQILQIWRIE